MPYVPNEPDTYERSKVYQTIWISAAASIPTFANTFIGWENFLMAILFGASVGGLIVAFMANRADEYFQAMIGTGMRWVMLILGLYLFAIFLLNISDISFSAGAVMAGGIEGGSGVSPLRHLLDANVLGKGLMITFYAGYAFAWSKDWWGG
ncbi:hypothetical protein [Erythrobacter sp. JK5]|uniref:hypothetical protein n=1 Tax=Erythrobacter sp. JK5 TaxID=2829500 RepID=UPI001BAD3AF8|nr:hypothetical protein [Erythrobacter sp. JK5]QUL38756.1 hypothetical protein KDC96_05115 [Erythrobacter sp. JK5]